MKQTEHSFDNTERGRLLFSPGMKLADLVESNYELLVVLARMGIPLGFGESSEVSSLPGASVPAGRGWQVGSVPAGPAPGHGCHRRRPWQTG